MITRTTSLLILLLLILLPPPPPRPPPPAAAGVVIVVVSHPHLLEWCIEEGEIDLDRESGSFIEALRVITNEQTPITQLLVVLLGRT